MLQKHIHAGLTATLLLLILLSDYRLAGQSVPNGWRLFEKVTYTEQFNKEANAYYLTPNFDSKIRQQENHEIILKGHFIPFDLEEKNVIILSKYPYSACFFCGGAGPESVAEIRFRERPPKFKADQVIQVSGRLKLNDKDINHMNFILIDAVLIKP